MTATLISPLTTFPAARLEADLGVAVLLPDGTQVAVFRIAGDGDGDGGCPDSYYAVDNIDPFTGAGVISRGLVGEHDGEPTVASPLLKQVFRLTDGRCLSDGSVRLRTWEVALVGDEVHLT